MNGTKPMKNDNQQKEDDSKVVSGVKTWKKTSKNQTAELGE
jgi:hypothetical protein